MKTYPLYSRTVEEATELQFKIVDSATRRFEGHQVLDLGDLGVVRGTNKPLQTMRVEQVFADTFDAEAACLVRGAGTGALRWALAAVIQPGGTLLIHDAPIYPTTGVTAQTMGLKLLTANFNDLDNLRAVLEENRGKIDAVLVQQARQKPDDSYDSCQVIALCNELAPGVSIVTDDNYAALKIKKIGCQAGGGAFYLLLLQDSGPGGVGAVVGKKRNLLIKYTKCSIPAAVRCRGMRQWPRCAD